MTTLATFNTLAQEATPGPLTVSKGRPVKQSNYGTYKQVISIGEGMCLRRVTITGDTAEIVQEVANNAASAPDLLTLANAQDKLLGQAREALETYADIEQWRTPVGPPVQCDDGSIAQTYANFALRGGDRGEKARAALQALDAGMV